MPGLKELGVLHIVWLCGTFYRSSLFLLCFPLGSWGCGSCFVVKSASIRPISLPARQPSASPIIPYQRPLSAIVVFHHLPQTRPAWLFVVVICLFVRVHFQSLWHFYWFLSPSFTLTWLILCTLGVVMEVCVRGMGLSLIHIWRCRRIR